MHRFTTYCDLAFLEEYTRIKPDKDVADWSEEEDQWKKVLDFLMKDSDVIVNTPKDDLSPALFERHPILRRLHDRPVGSRLSFDPEAFSGLEKRVFHEGDTNPWKLFLLNGTATPPAQLSAAYGALFLSASEALQTWARVRHQPSLNVSSRGNPPHFSWRDLERFAMPLTSLLVCDPFLLARSEPRKLQENVVPLIINLLPRGQNKLPVKIMLMTEKFDGRWSLEDVRRKLEGFIREQRHELKFSISIVIAKGLKDYHDRHVFMNYGFIKSGHSFDYFAKGKLERSTTIDFKSAIDTDELQTIIDKLRELARMVESSSKIPSWIAGSKENALLRAARRSAEPHVDA